MNDHLKVIIGSLIFAFIIVMINKVISYLITAQIPNIINLRSLILFIIMFIVCMQTITDKDAVSN